MQAVDHLIPEDAPVAVSDQLGAHLSERAEVYEFLERAKADWIAIDVRDTWLVEGETRVSRTGLDNLVSRLDADRRWTRVFERADVRVYRRAP